MKTNWTASDITNANYAGTLEIEDNNGEFRPFEVLVTSDRYIFGGSCNAGFLESGYMLREDGELSDLVRELETYYNDGPDYVSCIVCNDRM